VKTPKKARQKSVFSDKGTFFVFIPFFLEKKGNEEEKKGIIKVKFGKFRQNLGNFGKIWEISDKLREV
jgi:hypothetical protein